MKLNRITALGAVAVSALALGLLAVPATAMASTAGTTAATVAGTGPVPVKVRCPPPVLRLAPAPVPGATRIVGTVSATPVPVSAIVYCYCASVPRAVPIPVMPRGRPILRACSLPLVFDLATGASVATEVRGPRLSVHEVVFYRGNIYTVRSAWGDKFTLDFRGQLFVNHGSAVHDGHALAIRGGVFVVVSAAKPCPK